MYKSMKKTANAVKMVTANEANLAIQEVAKPTGAEILAELQANFCEADWPFIGQLYCECADLNFSSEDEEEEFGDQLLEAKKVNRSDCRSFGGVCWEQFAAEHPDWDNDDYSSYSWAGGGFYALPTVEYAERGTILFIAESQLEDLRSNPWICKWWTDRPWLNPYISIANIDELVIVPDERIA